MILYFYAGVLLASILFCAYGVYTLNQARKVLRESRANAERAKTVFEHARNVHSEVLRIQAHVKQLLPTPVTVKEEMLVPELADGDYSDDEPDPECAVPKYDYPNFDGLPVSENTPAAVMEALLNHGFIVRFNVPELEVHLSYQKPGTNYDPVRATYNPPADIFPVNNLHDAGKAATAIWAAKKFVSMNPFPEFDAFTYLHT